MAPCTNPKLCWSSQPSKPVFSMQNVARGMLPFGSWRSGACKLVFPRKTQYAVELPGHVAMHLVCFPLQLRHSSVTAPVEASFCFSVTSPRAGLPISCCQGGNVHMRGSQNKVENTPNNCSRRRPCAEFWQRHPTTSGVTGLTQQQDTFTRPVQNSHIDRCFSRSLNHRTQWSTSGTNRTHLVWCGRLSAFEFPGDNV